MRDLSAEELLSAWERGLDGSVDERALILLAAALPAATPGSLARLPVGRRDSALLALRERVFGSRLVSLAACPACCERVEMDFAVPDIRADGEAAGAGRHAHGGHEDLLPVDTPELELVHSGFEVRFHLPNTLDMRAAAQAADLDSARRILLESCLVQARHGGEAVAADALPESVRAVIGERMTAMDPMANLRLSLTCPACGHAWEAPFEIGAYFWEELNDWAQRVLREVHVLSSAYGWREADILALNPVRRRLYLDMVQG